MAEVFGIDTGVSIPSLAASSTFGNTITWILIGIVLIAIFGIIMFVILRRRSYNIHIKVFENIAGQGYQLTKSDRARMIKIGDGGEEILHLMKHKAYRTAYGKKMGKNTYWFAIGQDGYWYNVLLGDLDAKMGMLDIEPVDRDMRYAHVAIRKNIKERYNKQSFMEKYSAQVFGILTLLIFFVGSWFLVDQIGVLTEQLSATLEANKATAEAIQKSLAYIDSLNAGGSGITPA